MSDMKGEAYINKIIENTGLTRKEIQSLVEDKKEELKGLISEEGALFIIARELGVDVKEESKDLLNEIEIHISDITQNMKNISIVGRIKAIYNVNKFNKSDGNVGYVGSFLLNDTTGDIRIVLWDEHVNIFNDTNFEINELIKVVNGNAKLGRYNDVEIHVGRFGKLMVSPDDIDYNEYPKIKTETTNIREINLNLKSISIEGKIIRLSPLKEFTKKNDELGRLKSLTLLDSTGSIRITFWNDDVEKLESFMVDDTVSITNLNPRLNSLDSKTIDLNANRSTTVKKLSKKIQIEADLTKNIKKLQEYKGFTSFKGKITSIDNLKTIMSKSGEPLPLLGFVVSDNTDWIRVTLWREKAEEYAKKLLVGQGLFLKNVEIRFSDFSQRNEVTTINESELELITLEIDNLKTADFSTRDQPQIEGELIKEISLLQSHKGTASFKGKITSIDNLKTIVSKSGESLSLLGFVVSDNTDWIRVTLWREKAEEYAKELSVSQGLFLKNILVRYSDFSQRNEVTILKVSELELIELEMENLKTADFPKRIQEPYFSGNYKKIGSIEETGTVEVKGFIAKGLNNIIIYEACKKCSRKKENCECEVKEETEFRMIINLIIDDGSGSIRTTFMGEKAEKVLRVETDKLVQIKETPDFDKFLEKSSSELIGKDIIIRGRAKFSDYSNSYEIMGYDFKYLDIREELEKVIKEIET
jgi:replication factor A1